MFAIVFFLYPSEGDRETPAVPHYKVVRFSFHFYSQAICHYYCMSVSGVGSKLKGKGGGSRHQKSSPAKKKFWLWLCLTYKKQCPPPPFSGSDAYVCFDCHQIKPLK